MGRPGVAVRTHRPPVLRLLQELETAQASAGEEEEPASVATTLPEYQVDEQGVTLSSNDLKRLRRLVQMLTTVTSELTLWLASVGPDPR